MLSIPKKYNQYRQKIRNFCWGNTIVLLYHRIGEAKADPFSTFVTKNNFEEHIRMLQSMGEIIPANTLEQKSKEKFLSGMKFVITFDDGYLDNFEMAVPILRKHHTPATFFIVTADLPLKEMLRHREWRLNRLTPTMRHKVFKELALLFRTMKINEQARCLSQLADITGTEYLLEAKEKVNMATLQELISDGLFEIGSHTVHHPQLSSLNHEDQAYEISASKGYLETQLKVPIESFSIPYGTFQDYIPETIKLIKQAGYRRSFIVQPKAVNGRFKTFEIPRVSIADWDGKECKKYLHRLLQFTPQ